jgi:hypothetical protein
VDFDHFLQAFNLHPIYKDEKAVGLEGLHCPLTLLLRIDTSPTGKSGCLAVFPGTSRLELTLEGVLWARPSILDFLPDPRFYQISHGDGSGCKRKSQVGLGFANLIKEMVSNKQGGECFHRRSSFLGFNKNNGYTHGKCLFSKRISITGCGLFFSLLASGRVVHISLLKELFRGSIRNNSFPVSSEANINVILIYSTNILKNQVPFEPSFRICQPFFLGILYRLRYYHRRSDPI